MVHRYAKARLINSVADFGLRLKLVSGLVLVVTMISWAPPTGRAQLGLVLITQTKTTRAVRVISLKVRIVTMRNRGAGTDNAVYFDVGPLAWKLNCFFRNDFEAGSDDTYDLKVPPGMTTDDILWVRLHKKGIFGVTGTKDGIAGAWHPESVTLLVNDVEFVKIRPTHALNSSCWYWRAPKPDNSDLDLFARSLRIRPNDKLNFADKALGFFSTHFFKETGLSGWIADPLERECDGVFRGREGDELTVVCADGEITRRASSTDGLQTIDLRIS